MILIKEKVEMKPKYIEISEKDCRWEGDKLFIRVKNEDGQEIDL